MKKMIMSVVALVAMNVSAAQYTTVEVCDNNNEVGQVACRKVTYKVRPASAPVAVKETCSYGDVSEGPCPTVFGRLSLLEQIGQIFTDLGGKPANNDYTGGM